MSFDLYFLPAGVPWGESMEALEAAASDERALSDGELETWTRIEALVRTQLPDAESFAGEGSCELSDDDTGIQLSMCGSELSLTVPYWHEGESAERVVGILRSVCQIVEEATGLVGYDPQAEAPFL